MPRPHELRHTSQGLLVATGQYLRRTGDSMVVESAIAVTFLVVSFAVWAEIVNNAHTEHQMARAARAAARAVALDAGADACAAIRREFALADNFDCAATWTLVLDRGVRPSSLPATLDAHAVAGTGDMVLVRIGWYRDPWSFGSPVEGANAEDSEDEEVTVSMVAIGLARCENDGCPSGEG